VLHGAIFVPDANQKQPALFLICPLSEAQVARFARQIGALGRAGRLAGIANGAGLEADGGLLTVESAAGAETVVMRQIRGVLTVEKRRF
jgi:hypothetical protein